MAAGPWLMTNEGHTKLMDGEWVIGTDTFNMALFLSTSDLAADSTTYPATNEHANANGYLTGGIVCALTKSGTTTVTVVMTTAPIWTAAGGSIIAKFACIYEVAGRILCYCLLDAGAANVTVTIGNKLTVGADGATVFTLA